MKERYAQATTAPGLDRVRVSEELGEVLERFIQSDYHPGLDISLYKFEDNQAMINLGGMFCRVWLEPFDKHGTSIIKIEHDYGAAHRDFGSKAAEFARNFVFWCYEWLEGYFTEI